jgi:hypothetical protein
MIPQAAKPEAPDEKCPECGHSLNRATQFDEKPTGPIRQMFWCSNQHCRQYGVMIEKHLPTS